MYTYIYMTRPSLNLVLWAMMHSNRWLGVWLELCGNLLCVCVCVYTYI